nr:universal stress protein [Micromonospora sp. DSM 115978]
PRLVLGDQTDADLLVVGPRGQGELKALSIGSTADYVLHHPPAPLVIANAGRPVRRVLVCTDGSAAARRASTVLAGLPWAADVEVTVLSVADERHDHGVEIETAGKESAHALDPVVRTVETRHVRGPLNKT